MDALSWVRKQVEQPDTDLLREMVRLFCERVMSDEVDAICGASYAERSEDRTIPMPSELAPTPLSHCAQALADRTRRALGSGLDPFQVHNPVFEPLAFDGEYRGEQHGAPRCTT